VGHEPNFSSFISIATSQDYLNFTTANMAKINFDEEHWTKVQFSTGNLEWHQQPKNLENLT
jgi:phosphohistidine phosphatase SixA